MKYTTYDLGFGLHICPEVDDCLILNLYIVHTSLGKFTPPETDNSLLWDKHWNFIKVYANVLCNKLNSGELSETQVSRRIEKYNEKYSKGA